MKEDPIVEEVRRIREEHAAKHGHDLDAIFADLKDREAQDKGPKVSFPPKACLRRTGT